MKQKWKETGSVLVNVSKIICHKYCAGFLGQRRIRERRAEKNGIWIWPIANAAELHSHWKLFFPVAAPTAPEKTAIADCICRVADGTEKFVHVFAFDFHRPLSVWMRFQAKQPTRSRSLGTDTTNSWMHGFFFLRGWIQKKRLPLPHTIPVDRAHMNVNCSLSFALRILILLLFYILFTSSIWNSFWTSRFPL